MTFSYLLKNHDSPCDMKFCAIQESFFIPSLVVCCAYIANNVGVVAHRGIGSDVI